MSIFLVSLIHHIWSFIGILIGKAYTLLMNRGGGFNVVGSNSGGSNLGSGSGKPPDPEPDNGHDILVVTGPKVNKK